MVVSCFRENRLSFYRTQTAITHFNANHCSDAFKKAIKVLTPEDQSLVFKIDEKVQSLQLSGVSEPKLMACMLNEMQALHDLLHKTLGNKSALEFYYDAYPGFEYFMRLLLKVAHQFDSEQSIGLDSALSSTK